MGRIATAVMVLIALAWIPVVQNARGLYEYLQAVQGYLAPPIFVVFFFGVFFKRLNAKGCFAAMVVGFLLGIFRMAVDTPVTLGLIRLRRNGVAIGYAEHSFLWIINKINFQILQHADHAGFRGDMVGVSYLTKAPDYGKIGGLTFGTATAEDRRKTRGSWDWRDVLALAAILPCILGAYLYFREDTAVQEATWRNEGNSMVDCIRLGQPLWAKRELITDKERSNMIERFSRRKLLKQAAAATAAALGRGPSGPGDLADTSPNSKLATAVIGVGNQGNQRQRRGERADGGHGRRRRKPRRPKHGVHRRADPETRTSGIKVYYDYRKMFDQMHGRSTRSSWPRRTTITRWRR